MNIFRHRGFERQFKRLPKKVRTSFHERIDLFLQDKFHPLLENHPLHGKYTGLRSINVTGDYRVLFEENTDTVIFKLIGTHHELFGS